MKRKVLAMLVPALLVAGAANAAEIYNKDGNKLDLYGKVAGLHYFSDDAGSDGDKSYARIGFKGETQSLTSSLVMVSGNTTCKQMAQKAMEITLLPVWLSQV